MHLSDAEKSLIKALIDRNEPLPPKYKYLLFADVPEVELLWQGKTQEVTKVVLPFQSIEHIDEPRSDSSRFYPVMTGDFTAIEPPCATKCKNA